MINSSISDSINQRVFVDRRTLKDRRATHSRRKQIAIEKQKETVEKSNISTFIHVTGALLMILVGVMMCIFTGLFNPYDPTVEQTGLSAGISLWYSALFRHALYL